MAQPTDTAQDKADRQAIQEAIHVRMEEERAEKARMAEAERRAARDKRSAKRKKAREERVARQKTQRVAAMAKSQERVSGAVQDASRALRRALRAAQEHKFHRHSPEGREQLRLVRNLQAAMGSLRAVGRSAYYSPDGVDPDFDDFDVGAVD